MAELQRRSGSTSVFSDSDSDEISMPLAVPLAKPSLRLAFSHVKRFALANGGATHDQCLNLMFHKGPCNICLGECFALLDDKRLSNRLLSGKKTVGTFTRRNKWEAWAVAKLLQSRGLTTWQGKNKWNVYVVVACLHPDKYLAKAACTPREAAFTQAFIDEELPLPVVGAMYGYPPCGLY